MNEFFHEPINKREALKRIGSLIGARPLIRAVGKLAVPAAAGIALGALPPMPYIAEGRESGSWFDPHKVSYSTEFTYNKSQQRIVSPGWVNTLPEEAPWPTGPSRNWLPMTDAAALRWRKTPPWGEGGVGQRFDRTMGNAGQHTQLKELLWQQKTNVVERARELQLPQAYFESFGYCYAYAAAATLMREPLKSNLVYGEQWDEDNIKALVALAFAHCFEEPTDLGAFFPNEQGVGKPIVVETTENFYNPLYGTSRDKRWINAGDLDIAAVMRQGQNQLASTLYSVNTYHHPNAEGESVKPWENVYHFYSILSQAPMSTIMKIAYEPNPQF